MEMNYIKIFKFVFIILFIIFLTLFFSGITGFYEYQNRQKSELTKEQIAKFEIDIKNGVAIDMKTYLNNTEKNYQNNFSSFGNKLSNAISNVVASSVDRTFDTLIKFVEQ